MEEKIDFSLKKYVEKFCKELKEKNYSVALKTINLTDCFALYIYQERVNSINDFGKEGIYSGDEVKNKILDLTSQYNKFREVLGNLSSELEKGNNLYRNAEKKRLKCLEEIVKKASHRLGNTISDITN